MLCRQLVGTASVLLLAIASSVTSGQTTIFEDTFESYGVQNPAADPLGPWTYTGPGGANASRTFQPNPGAGADTNSIGWISLVDNSFIGTTVSLGSLAGTEWADGGGNLFDSNLYTLSFMHTAETSDVARDSQFLYAISNEADTLAFDSGGNGDGSHMFTGLSDNGANTGGSIGKAPA
ncbi:MAG: hypothetical protein KDA60_21960, partial [Planctomycetales bacterium]|nr:hypothetical protein [Planctomycetales bacterium]